MLHQQKRSDASLSDEYETPFYLYNEFCIKYKIFPKLDVCANKLNSKCEKFLTDGLNDDWINDVWCNPPHSKTEQFVRKAHERWRRFDINIMMIIPTNTMSSKYWHECIEGIAEYHPIKGRIKFLVDGKLSKYPSRNAYVCVIWRKKL